MADLPAKQSVFTRVRNSILNAGISNNFTRNIIANFAPNIFGSNLIDFVSASDNANLDKTMELISSMNSQTIQANYNVISRKFFSISSQFNTEAVINRMLDTLNQETRQTLSEEMLKDNNIIFGYGKVTDEICEKIVSGIDFQTKTSEEIDQMIESVKPSRKISYNLFSQLTLSQKKDFFSTFSEQFLTLPLGSERRLKDMLEQFDEPDRLEQYNKILKSCASYKSKSDEEFGNRITNLINCFQTLSVEEKNIVFDETIDLLHFKSTGKSKISDIVQIMDFVESKEQIQQCEDMLNYTYLELINGDIDNQDIYDFFEVFSSEERQKKFVDFLKEKNLQLATSERIIALKERGYDIERLTLSSIEVEKNGIINRYLNNRDNNNFVIALNEIKKLYSDIDLSEKSFKESQNLKLKGIVNLFSTLSSKESHLLDIPEVLETFVDVLDKFSIKELEKIFSGNLILEPRQIEKLMQQKSGITIKALYFDGDVDRDKLVDIVLHKQLQSSNVININSLISRLYAKDIKIGKKEFNHDLNDVYNLFTYNNVPEFLKTFRIFQLGEFHDIGNGNIQSFEGKNITERDTIILEDLFKISLASNSESLREFAEVITEGKQLTTLLQVNPEEKIKTLSVEERALLEQYRDTLFDLHNITAEVRDTGRTRIEKTDDVINDLRTLISVYSDNKEHNSSSKNIVFNPNKIMDELFKGFVTTTIRPRAMLEYMDKVKENADARHLQIEEQLKSGKMHLQEGDFIKEIQNFDDYIPSMLRDGIKGGEFNQEYSHSDATPLDADFGYISALNLTTQGISDYEVIQTTISAEYGSNYVVLKQYAERLENKQSTNFENQATFNGSTDFYALEGATANESRYIRTGIPITDVDYIVSADWNPKNGYEMAMAGMYIPVIDSKGEVVFSSEDYKKIREEMRGLSRYHAEDIVVSEKAKNMEALYETYRKVSTKSAEETEKEIEAVKALVEGKEDETTSKKKKATTDFIKGYFESKGIRVVDDLSQNLSTNSVELIDTGSTGRGTNVPGDGDFDFMLRHNLPDDVIKGLTEKVESITPQSLTNVSDGFRSKGAVLPNGEVVDIDVTAAKKDLALSYSSDMCVRDRLDNIRTHSPADYNYVQANIIMAKKILKAEGVYKKAGSTGATKYGGFGGIGVENWVLQNGGSFEQAIDTFMDTANQVVDYNDFKRKYPIFDFGFNHREGKIRHDRFSAFLGVEGEGENAIPIGFNYVKEIFPTLQQTMTLENEKQSERENGIEPESPLMQSISAKGFAEAGKNKSDLRNKFSFSQIRGLVAKYMSMQSVQQETRNTNNSLEEKDD